MVDGTERREPKGFEPPPWEQERFEELAHKRAQEDAAREAWVRKAAAHIGKQEADPVEAEATSPPKSPGVDPATVDVMLAGLRGQESTSGRASAWRAGLAAGVLLVLLGTMILVWGAVALARTRDEPAAVFGAAVMLLFGAAFVGGGAWIGIRSLRQRGVG